jgi:hypothetical protein
MGRLSDIEELHEEPLSRIIQRNQSYLGKPIVPNMTFPYLLATTNGHEIEEASDYEAFMKVISDYLYSNQDELIRSSEEKLRTFFKAGAYTHGLPQFVTVHHAPQCWRDVFITTENGERFLFVGSIRTQD